MTMTTTIPRPKSPKGKPGQARLGGGQVWGGQISTVSAGDSWPSAWPAEHVMATTVGNASAAALLRRLSTCGLRGDLAPLAATKKCSNRQWLIRKERERRGTSARGKPERHWAAGAKEVERCKAEAKPKLCRNHARRHFCETLADPGDVGPVDAKWCERVAPQHWLQISQ